MIAHNLAGIITSKEQNQVFFAPEYASSWSTQGPSLPARSASLTVAWRAEWGFALSLLKSFLSQTRILHFKHYCTKTSELLLRVSSPDSLQRTQRNMSSLKRATASLQEVMGSTRHVSLPPALSVNSKRKIWGSQLVTK